MDFIEIFFFYNLEVKQNKQNIADILTVTVNVTTKTNKKVFG